MSVLEELRKEHGWNMREAAAALGLKYTTYVSYEKGDRQPNSEQLLMIAKFYGVTVDHLLGRDKKSVFPQVTMIGRAAEKMSEEQRDKMLQLLKIAFPEEFE